MDVQVNYWAVLLAALSTMVVGFIWYARPVFGNAWAKLAKVDMTKSQKGMGRILGLTFLFSLLTAYILAHVTYLAHAFFGNSFFQDAVSTAFWLWLGLVVARMTTHTLFEQRPAKLMILNAGNELVTIMVIGVILGLMPPESAAVLYAP